MFCPLSQSTPPADPRLILVAAHYKLQMQCLQAYSPTNDIPAPRPSCCSSSLKRSNRLCTSDSSRAHDLFFTPPQRKRPFSFPNPLIKRFHTVVLPRSNRSSTRPKILPYASSTVVTSTQPSCTRQRKHEERPQLRMPSADLPSTYLILCAHAYKTEKGAWLHMSLMIHDSTSRPPP